MNNRFLLALATLVGTIVGAGIFGLPYAFSKSGIIPGILYLVVLGGVVLLLHLMLGEIALRTKEKHRLIGYASLYLGKWAKTLVTISTFVGTIGALVAYIILGGKFLHIVFSSFVPFSSFTFALLFWFFLSLLILKSIQTIARAEFVLNVVLFLVIGIIFAFALPHFSTQNFATFDSSYLFLPYGVVLFSFWGLSAIPEVAELFKSRKERRSLDNLIVWASIIVGILYVLFCVVVIGVSGFTTTQDALEGLIPFLGERAVVLGAFFGLLVVADSFLVLGNYLKNSFVYDYKFPYGFSFAIAVLSPALLFVLGLREFVVVVGAVGALVAVIEGLLVVLIYGKAKEKGDREPEYSISISRFVLVGIGAFLILGAFFEFFA